MNLTTMTQPSSQSELTTQMTHGQTRISLPRTTATAPLDLIWYINNIYGPQHFVTTEQLDGTYHIYHNMRIGDISEIQYNLNRKRFEPRNVHLDLEYLQRVLEEYQFLDMFMEDSEISEKPKEVEESFFTPPESLQPSTPQPCIRELPSETSVLQHRTLTPAKSSLKVRFSQ